MPLDTSSYSLALLRLDGRRWNELRRINAQISTQAAADGSSYLEMGNTKVICTVSGPGEGKGGRGSGGGVDGAELRVEIGVGGFSVVGGDRKRRGRGDKQISELQTTIATSLSSLLLLNLYPHSLITLTLTVLSSDGSLLSTLLNASTLALIDAGIPMTAPLWSCTSGSTSSYSSADESADPLLDLNRNEEMELPFLTVGVAGGVMGTGGDGMGGGDKVVVLVMETRVQGSRLEGMVAVGVDGCRRVGELLDEVVRGHGKKILDGMVE